MRDYEFKAHVMALGLHQTYKDISKTKYKYLIEEINQQKIADGVELDYIPQFNTKYNILQALDIEEYYKQNYPAEWKEASRINHASICRVSRLQKRLHRLLLSGTCLFLTLTFDDKHLNRTTKETRRQLVRRYLASISTKYVANIDYGAKNGREHYHAVVLAEHIDPKSYKLGAINFKKIVFTDNDTKRIAKYIAKLTNHAIKETTKQNYLIYSR